MTETGERVRVLRVIARMNIGGPAYHVSLLSGRMDPERYDTVLVSGRPGPGEGSFEALAHRHGARLRVLETLTPVIDPLSDARALYALRRMVLRFRPHIVDTHTAKAGTLGRIAALTVRPRPILVHTFHGHVLEGYFGPAVSSGYRGLERVLARFSDRLIGVSQATVDDLVRLGVAGNERFAVVPLGLELDRFLALDAGPDPAARAAIGAGEQDAVALYAGRLVPIKRVDLLVRAVAAARRSGVALRLVVLGDGELRPSLESLARDLNVETHVHFLGYRPDVVPYLAAADMAVLSSANEGTPVSLIEAAAAARPMVGTRVGGVADVVAAGTGRLVESGDEAGLTAAMTELAGKPELRRELGARGRAHVRERYASGRLLRDMEGLYDRLLAERALGRRP